jgi:hypothetical protein
VKRLNINDSAEVIERFAIEKNETCATLDHWLEASGVLTATEKELLNEIRRDILILGRDWNEEELKMNFVAIIFFIAKLKVPKKIQVFYERKLAGEVEGIPISVKVDGCWLQGKVWNFTTLIGKSYCVSRLYDATNVDDLHQIVFILRRLKDLILNR